jgi:hypothetical protein
MRDPRHFHLDVLWEHIDGQDCADLFRQIVVLVLKDRDEPSTHEGIDMQTPIGINESVPVENTNKS